MIRFITIILFFFLIGCSFTKTSFWTQDEKIKVIKKNRYNIFNEKEISKKEFNQNFKINLKKPLNNFNPKDESLANIIRVANYNNEIKKTSKFKFSKIDDFDYFEPELSFDGKNFIFFDDKGTIFKFDNNFNLIWKKNFYSKQEKKLKPILTFANEGNLLIVLDNIAKFYAININTGDLVWSKINSNPVNSQVKINDNKIFSIDLNNILRCFSIKDGSEIWQFKSENTFLKSTKRNSLIIMKDRIYINNSLGDISAIDINDGALLWQVPTQTSEIYENAFSLVMSDIVAKKDNLIFSNNRNEFFSINVMNGVVNWKQEINSSVRPIFYNNLIFTLSDEGFFYIIDSKTGNIIKITNIFSTFKKKERNKTKPVGFIATQNKLLVSTNRGKLLIIDIKAGKSEKILKIDNEKISRPFLFGNKILLVTNNSIIKLN